MLTGESRATSPGVEAARLSEAERAGHAAAAAGLAEPLAAVLGQRLAQKTRGYITWLASYKRSHRRRT